MNYPFVLSIAGFIIITLFGVIGYLFKTQRQESQNNYSDLLEATTNIKEASIELRSSVTNMRTNCVEKHTTVDKRLDQHAIKLSNHDHSIATIEATLQLKK